MSKLTPRQSECVRIIDTYFKKNDQFPPIRTIADRMDVNPNAAYSMMAILERKKVIRKNEAGKWRRGVLYPNDF